MQGSQVRAAMPYKITATGAMEHAAVATAAEARSSRCSMAVKLFCRTAGLIYSLVLTSAVHLVHIQS